MSVGDSRDPGYQLHALAFNAASRAADNQGELVSLTTRLAMTNAVLREVVGWLTSDAVVGHGGAAIVGHDVGDCTHFPDRDCHDEQAKRAYAIAAQMIRTQVEVRP